MALLRPALRGLVVASCLLVSCSSGEKEGADLPAGTPRPGGTAVIALNADPSTLNPVRMANAQAAQVFALLQPGLVRLDPESGDWGPGLAQAWTFGEDSLEVVLELDTDLRWSDGEAFTADDVVATFDLYRDPQVAYPRQQRLAALESIDAVDDGRVRARFVERLADPLSVLTHDVLPAHVIAVLDRDDPASWSIGRAPVTLGRYRLASWDSNDRLVLERNPHHPGPIGLLERVEIAIVPDGAARLLQLRTGEVDIVGSVPQTQAEPLRAESDVHIEPVAGRSVAFLQYDLEDPRLQDVRVRKAISLAIDRRAIVDGVLFGYAEPAASFLPPVSWAHAEDMEPDPHDPDAARALLRDAGFVDQDGDGVVEGEAGAMRLTLHTVAGDPVRESIAVALQAQLADVGIELQMRPMDLGSLLRTVRSEDFDLLFLQLSGPVDTDLRPFLTSAGQFNFGAFADEDFDRLAEAAATAMDRARARELALEFQRLLHAEQPVSPLYYPSTLVAHRKRLNGVDPTWLSPFDGFETWWVSDADATEATDAGDAR